MRRKLFVLCVFVVLIGKSSAETPNIILLVADDQGYGDFGVTGNHLIKTPHLDRLADQSFEMTRFYVNAVCSPTRASLMTGRSSYRTGVTDTFKARSTMRTEEVTLAEMLSGIRKFGVSLVLAHQYLDQLPRKLKSALLGTVGTVVAFRIGALDLPLIEPEFQLTNDDYSLCELQPYEAYVRTGFTTSKLAMPEIEHRVYPSAPSRIRNFCRSQYAADRIEVERRIAKFIQNT